MKVTITAVRLIAPRDFIQAVMEELPEAGSMTNAFNRLNDLYEDEVGHPRYADFHSFKAAKCYHLKRLRASRPEPAQMRLFEE